MQKLLSRDFCFQNSNYFKPDKILGFLDEFKLMCKSFLTGEEERYKNNYLYHEVKEYMKNNKSLVKNTRYPDYYCINLFE